MKTQNDICPLNWQKCLKHDCHDYEERFDHCLIQVIASNLSNLSRSIEYLSMLFHGLVEKTK